MGDPAPSIEPARGSALEVLRVFTRLGLTSFGGPVAHLACFREALVVQRRWVSEAAYADLVALCQFLPGPASSQVAMAIGVERAGLPGALAAWVGFTSPSALLLLLFAWGLGATSSARAAPFLHGLLVVAVPVVALAISGMARALCPDRARATIAVVAAAAVLVWQAPLAQVAIMAAAALVGAAFLREAAPAPASAPTPQPLSRRVGVASLALFLVLLLGLPALVAATPSPALDLFERFYRTGSLVFGGGHVVLPLLEREVVGPGWVARDEFLAGYGAAQAVPGPMFSFAAYLGFAVDATSATPGRWAAAALALAGVFLPSLLLVVGALPFWSRLRARPLCQAALRGTNAAVVGLLGAALYDPVWQAAILRSTDLALALGAFLALAVWRLPPWLVVLLTALASGALGNPPPG